MKNNRYPEEIKRDNDERLVRRMDKDTGRDQHVVRDPLISAIEFGRKHGSYAMDWRKSLGPCATQAYAYQVCERGDYLIWQLQQLTNEKLRAVLPALLRAVDVIVARAAAAKASADSARSAARAAARAAAAKASADAARAAALAARYADAAVAAAPWVARSSRSAGDVAAWTALAAMSASSAAAASARSTSAASASWADARAAELKQQAEDIRAEIPEWPGE